MRHEINNLQRQLQSLESRRINYEELDAVVQKFDGDDHQDIVKWFSIFEDYTMMAGFNNNELLLALKRLLRGSARMYIENVDATNYYEIKQSLIKTFKRTVTCEEVYRKLRLPTIKQNESCISYVIAMQTIDSRANGNEKEIVDTNIWNNFMFD